MHWCITHKLLIDKFYRFGYDLNFKAQSGQINIVLRFCCCSKTPHSSKPANESHSTPKWRSCVFLRVGMWCPLSSERFTLRHNFFTLNTAQNEKNYPCRLNGIPMLVG